MQERLSVDSQTLHDSLFVVCKIYLPDCVQSAVMQTPSTKKKEAQGIRGQEQINTINNLFHNKSNCYLKIIYLWWVQLHLHIKLSLYILYLFIDIQYYL